jgi:hypothetical protein
MALFAGQPQIVTTPDGRTLTLPSDLAAQFPGLAPAPAGPLTLPSGGAPNWSPDDTAGLAALTPPPDATAAPVTTPAQVPSGGPEFAPRPSHTPVTDPGPEAGAQPVTPAPPLSNAQLLQQYGPAGSVAASDKAVEGEKAANVRSAQVEADTATKQGDVLAARDAETQKILAERARAAQENAAKLNSLMQARDVAVKKVADTKVDRGLDHPVWAAIGVALGGIGAAIQQKQYGGAFHNQAYDAMIQAIDRKVAAQMADLDKRRADIAQMNVGIGEHRQAAGDRLAEIDVRKAGALEQAQQAVQTIATQQKSPQAQANAGALNAKLEEEKVKLKENAASRLWDQTNAEAARKQSAQQHAESIGLQRRGQDLEDKRFYFGQQVAERDRMAALSEKYLAAGEKAAAEKAKKVSELGVNDPVTGDLLLTPEGEKKMADADSYEAQARKVGDPQQAAQLNQQAQLLRDSAKLNDAAIATNRKIGEEAQKAIKITYVVHDLVSNTLAKLEKDPGAIDREQWAAITADIANVKARYVATLGERVTVGALKAFDHVLSIDPDSWISREVDKGKAMAALKVLRSDAEVNAAASLKSAGIKTKWKPGQSSEDVKFGGKTAKEVGEDATPGIASRVLTPLTGSLDERSPVDKAQNAALGRVGAPNPRTGAPGKPSNYGLDPADDDKARALIKRAGSAGNKAYAGIVEQLAVPLQGDRGSLYSGFAHLIRDEDPKLFADVLKAIRDENPMRAKELEAATAPLSPGPGPSALTPGAEKQLAGQRARISQGLPADVPPVVPLTPTSQTQLPAFLRGASPADQQRYLDGVRKLGIGGVQ